MEKIIKLQSEQGFSETAKPGAFINSKLIDFVIPRGACYDLSKSYINLNMTLDAVAESGAVALPAVTSDDTALYNMDLNVNNGETNIHNSSCAQLVRNAQLYSSDRGMIESIRRVDTLKECLWNLENNKTAKLDSLEVFGTTANKRGDNQRTSTMRDVVVVNTDNNGNVINGLTSRNISRDFRMPLSEIFGIGNAVFDTNNYGDTRVHLEISPNKLNIENLSGDENNTYISDGNFFGACEDDTSGGTAFNTLTFKYPYYDPQLMFPFYCGQAIEIEYDTNASFFELDTSTVGAIEWAKTGQANIIMVANASPYQYWKYKFVLAGGTGTATHWVNPHVEKSGSGETTSITTDWDVYTAEPNASTGPAVLKLSYDATTGVLSGASGGALGVLTPTHKPDKFASVPVTTPPTAANTIVRSAKTYTIIDSIKHIVGASGTTDLGKVEVTTRSPWNTLAPANNPAGRTFASSSIEVNAVNGDAVNSLISINRAEIVLSEMPGVKGPKSIDYITYTTEETYGPLVANLKFNHQFIIEPNAQNLIIASCPTGNVTPTQPWSEYSLVVDNVDQTGNRAVVYDSSLHKDRVLRFCLNKGMPPQDLSLGTSNEKGESNESYIIYETLPLTQGTKMVNLELSPNTRVKPGAPGGAGSMVEDVVVFKEIVKTI